MNTEEIKSELRQILEGYMQDPTTCGIQDGGCKYYLSEDDGRVKRCVVGQFLHNHGVSDDLLTNSCLQIIDNNTLVDEIKEICGGEVDLDLFVAAQNIHDYIAFHDVSGLWHERNKDMKTLGF